MLSRKLVPGVMLLTVAILLGGCGSYKAPKKTTPVTGGLVILVGDDPACNVLSFRATIRGIKLVPQGGGESVLPLGADPFLFVDFASLRDTSTILHIGQVNEGTYDQAQIEFGATQMGVFDGTLTPPVRNSTTTSSNPTPTFPIDPPLVITKDAVAGLRVDFDLQRSITVNSQGRITQAVSPVVKLTSVTADDTSGFGRMETLNGFVLSVTNSSTVEEFTGSFSMQALSGSSGAPVVSVSLKPDTDLFGVSGLNQLSGGSYVEVNGIVDAKGNIVADTVEVEAKENSATNRLALIGPILSITKDANGNAKDFDLFVAGEQPESQFALPLGTVVHVTLSSSTRYQFSSRPVNFASLPFDATSLAVGQDVVVHGPFTKASDDSFSVPGEAVYLKLQTRQGNLTSLVKASSDDKTGAFFMSPCEGVLQGSPLLVFTNNQTAFVNVNGLSGLTAPPSLLIKGLLFFDLEGGTVRGVTVPPETLVLLANQVHKLP